uniref:Aminopeptidase N n=2 Tax=Timema TaxID=61471 RepID=A0A7R9IAG8_9NEOP|nr:unnamed protein product [Timema tahoe]
MPVESSIPDPALGLTWDHFEETPMPMSSYLVAFVVSDFVALNRTLEDTGVVYRNWQRAAAINQSMYSIDISPRIMTYLDNFTGIPYFLPKVDQVAVPDFSAGAMENWGLVTYRERNILYEVGVASAENKQRTADIISHEFAHKWFGNLVSPKWWGHLWLNEGFARYFQYFATAQVKTDWRYGEQFIVRQVHQALSSDSLESSHPMTHEVSTPSEAWGMFSTISYAKGASVIRMAEHFLGSTAFQNGLQEYLSNHGNQTTEPDYLFNVLQSHATGIDVKAILDTWTLQKNYPVITVTRNYGTGGVTVRQERFLLRRSGVSDSHVYRWYVPLTYTTQTQLDFNTTSTKQWLPDFSTQATIGETVSANQWILFNIQQTGFYRVNYDAQNWALLANYLNSDSFTNIHVLNRAQLLDDSFNLARAEILDYTTALEITKYLSRETDYIPWYSALSSLSYLNNRLRGASEYDYYVFKNYLKLLLGRVYTEVGLEVQTSDGHVTKLLRNSISTWACDLGDQTCIDFSRRELAAYMANPENYLVDPDVKSVVFCNGLRYGGEEEWNFLWGQYLKSEVSTEQVLILGILGCTNTESLAHRYLNLTITEDAGIRTQDIALVAPSVYNNPAGVDFAINYLFSHYQDIANYNGGSYSSVISLISGIGGALSSQNQYQRLRDFIEEADLGASAWNALATAERNLLWLETNGPSITSWLRSQNYRLPETIVPDTYSVKLIPYLEGDVFTFDGEVLILVNVTTATNRITLHVNDLEIDDANVSVRPLDSAEKLTLDVITRDEPRHFLDISVPAGLTAGQQYEVNIQYQGYMRDDMFGFYRSYYYVRGEKRWLGTTQFQPTHARRAFPSFDEPSFKAKFKMSIARPANYHALFNTRKIEQEIPEQTEDGRIWDHFEETPYMSTYLIAFVVSDFDNVTNAVGNVTIWQREEASPQASYALSISQPTVTAMERLIGHDYQLPKLDKVAIPDFSAGAMENWGIVTYRVREKLGNCQHVQKTLYDRRCSGSPYEEGQRALDTEGENKEAPKVVGEPEKREEGKTPANQLPREGQNTHPLQQEHLQVKLVPAGLREQLQQTRMCEQGTESERRYPKRDSRVPERYQAGYNFVGTGSCPIYGGDSVASETMLGPALNSHRAWATPISKGVGDIPTGRVERLILWDEIVSTTSNKQTIATIVAHEIAHKWFGNLVTLQWWKYAWLNEGFATYFETFATALVEPDWRLEEQFVLMDHQSALSSDALETSRPMMYDVDTPSEIWSVFDFVNYAKAGTVIRMMEHFLTRDTFLKGLHTYLANHGYSNSEPDNLFAALQEQLLLDSPDADLNVKTVMDTWINQMGYPVVTVTRNYSSASASVSQERFLIQRNPDSTDSHDYKWWIPLSYTRKTGAQFNVTTPSIWLQANESQIVIENIAESSDWIIFNLQESAYYRVNYDANNWNSLISQLNSEDYTVIPPVNRAQLLDDSLNLARAGILDYATALSVTSYLSKESDYIPWASAFTAFSLLDRRLKGAADEDYQLFKNYVLNLIGDLYNTLGFDEKPTDHHLDKFLRSNVLTWACSLGLEDCINRSKEELAKQMSNASYNILADVSSTVYCNALRHGGHNEWNHLWARYMSSNVGTEQVLLLNVLGCSNNEHIINSYLSLSITPDSGIRSQDASSVFVAVYSNPAGVDLAFNFLRDNYQSISEFYGGMGSIGNILTGIAARLSTREQADALREFVEENQNNLGTALGASRRALETVEENLVWLGQNGEDIFNWLRDVSPTTSSTESTSTTSTGTTSTGTTSTGTTSTTTTSTSTTTEPIAPDTTTQGDGANIPFHPEQFKFKGNVTITLNITEATDRVTLHANIMEIDTWTVAKTSTEGVPVSVNETFQTESTDDHQFFILYLNDTMTEGSQYAVSLGFTGELRDDMFGFYRSSYTFNNEVRWIAATQFSMTQARRAFPCFDEPAFKAKFQINIAHYNNLTALSNMPLMATSDPDPELNGRVWDHFYETVPMSTYLVGFVVTDFKNITNDYANFSVWAREDSIENGNFSQIIGMALLQELERYTDIEYPLPKIDQVALPDFAAGAMENWGLVTYRETSLLFDEKESTATNRANIAMIIGHELSHMWFGNLVSPDWWRYTWLKEGFARYFQYFITDKVKEGFGNQINLCRAQGFNSGPLAQKSDTLPLDHQLEPTWRLRDIFLVAQQHEAFSTDSLNTTDSLNNDCSTPDEILAKFSTIAYNKGACVLRLIRHALTEETFRKGLQRYLNERQYNTAEPYHLYSALHEQATADNRLSGVEGSVEILFEKWASQPGYPVITVTRNYEENSATITQARFLLAASDDSSLKWTIPLSWTSQSGSPGGFNITTPKEWFYDTDATKKIADIATNDEWIIFNNQESGYYRVNYDYENWNKIAYFLESDVYENIHVVNRAQLLNDAFNLARAGQLSYETVLNVTRYLSREKDYIPWNSAFTGLSFINRFLRSSDEYSLFVSYVLGLIESLYDSVGFEQGDNDDYTTILVRASALSWACNLGHEDCVSRGRVLFNTWLNTDNPDEQNPILSNLRRVIYCSAVSNGDMADWNFLWDRYNNATLTATRTLIITALGCTKNTTILESYLFKSIDETSGIRKQDAATVFSAVYANRQGVDIALDFLVQNFDNVSVFYGGLGALGNAILDLGDRLTLNAQVEKARRAFPCFDEPAFKAKFQINIAHYNNLTALSNMPLMATSDPDSEINGCVWDHLYETVPMSTYLVGFVVTDFKNITNDYANFTVWAREDSIENGNFSQIIGMALLQELERYTGIEYPLPKIDQVSLPDFAAGAMENWGLVTYRIILLACVIVLIGAATTNPHHVVAREKREAGVNYRLPTSISPISYIVYLVPFHPEQFKFTGNVTITVNVTEVTNSVRLHANRLDIGSWGITSKVATERPVSVEGAPVTDNSTTADLHFLTLNLSRNLTLGQQYDISFNFTGTLEDDMYGFYRSSYTVDDEVRWIAATQFESTSARRAFPCFDEPAFKAKFQINIARFTNMSAISNMPLLKTSSPDPELDGRVWEVFQETTLPMSTYLVAFIVSDFANKSNAYGNFTVWARQEAIDQGDYSQDVGVKSLAILNDYTGIKYALPKVDQVALPDFAAGAMENWGLVTYRETGLLYDEKESTASNKASIAMVIAHELTHQWFGNLVTLHWWQYAWLNEGFARYFQYVIINEIEPSWRVLDQFVVAQQQSIFSTDSLNTTASLNSECSTPGEISSKFGSNTYSKGASVIRMIRHALTEETFKKGLQQYLNARQTKTAEPTHLYSALHEHAQTDGRLASVEDTVETLFEKWASQPGYPVIMVTRNYEDNSVTIRQSRFYMSKSQASSETWSIPLSWTLQENAPYGFETTTPERWLHDYEKSIEINNVTTSNQWIIFNNQESGYYRVNYDSDNWNRIISFLKSDSYENIHVLNRAQLLDDALNLARAGQLSYETALSLSQYLTREEDYIPWYSAFTGFSFISRLLANSNGYEQFKSVVYCTAIANGGSTEWNFLWERYSNSTLASTRTLILSALGCSKSTTILNNYLKKSVTNNSGIRKQDASSVFSAVYSNTGINTALDFLIDNSQKIKEFYGGMNAVTNSLTGIASRLTTTEQVAKLEKFITENPDILESAQTGMNAVESAKSNLNWNNDNYDTIVNWLKNSNPSNSVGRNKATMQRITPAFKHQEVFPETSELKACAGIKI